MMLVGLLLCIVLACSGKKDNERHAYREISVKNQQNKPSSEQSQERTFDIQQVSTIHSSNYLEVQRQTLCVLEILLYGNHNVAQQEVPCPPIALSKIFRCLFKAFISPNAP
jgi:hypothetical protein